jgi:hypothetical protein
MNMACVQTSIHGPWQNGVAERWVRSCRRDFLDHVIALNEHHLKPLLGDYIRYYHTAVLSGLNALGHTQSSMVSTLLSLKVSDLAYSRNCDRPRWT